MFYIVVSFYDSLVIKMISHLVLIMNEWMGHAILNGKNGIFFDWNNYEWCQNYDILKLLDFDV